VGIATLDTSQLHHGVATDTASRQFRPLTIGAAPQQIRQTADHRACEGNDTNAARHAVSPSAAGQQSSPTTNSSTYGEGGAATAGTDTASWE